MTCQKEGMALLRSSVDLLSGKTTTQEIQASVASKGPYLLGIDGCHLNRQSRVREKNGVESSEGYFVTRTREWLE
jgi:hypothetical protein